MPGDGRPVAHVVKELGIKRGPARLGPLLGIPASTVHAVLTRHGLHRLAWLDRPTGQLIRRYERDRPGELVHVDVKKIGRLRDGGGWRVHGHDSPQRAHSRSEQAAGRRVGYEYIHAAIDDHTRLAYAEIHPDEKPAPAPGSYAAPPPTSPPSASTASNAS